MSDKQKFIELVNARIKRKGIVQLMEWLEKTDYYIAPASCRHHLAIECGLLRHSLNVYNRLVRLYELEYGAIPDDRHETLAICGLFHDFCKIFCYTKMWKNVKVYKDNGSKFDGGGRFDWETRQGYTFDEKFPFGFHGPKSAFLVSRFMWLSDEEFITISNHMGVFDRQHNDYSLKNA